MQYYNKKWTIFNVDNNMTMIMMNMGNSKLAMITMLQHKVMNNNNDNKDLAPICL